MNDCAHGPTMKCLLLYYSFTGQAQRAVNAVFNACRNAGWVPTTCRVDFATDSDRLKRPLSIGDIKRWTAAAGETRFPLATIRCKLCPRSTISS